MHLSALTYEQLAGQRLMVGFDGTTFNDDLRFLIGTLNIGGVILFTRNIVSPDQLRELCTEIQHYGRQSGLAPLLIAIDQEGGEVARLKIPFTQLPGASQMRDEEDVTHFARMTAADLRNAGVNMNMAPVLDVAPKEISSVMASRSFGDNPLRVAAMGCLMIDQLQRRNIMAVAKHFPGIGRTVLDSHDDMPTLSVDLEELKQVDLIPFDAAIDHRTAGMMLSHIFYDRIDPEWPASLSPKIVGDVLRQDMGYDGLVLTDDLDMGAIKRHYDIRTIVRQVLVAGVDVALICHKGPDIENAHEEMIRQMSASADLRLGSMTSVARVLKLKRQYLGYRWFPD
ncbi:MAG: beta-N-acetylhexosaminidase [Desulfobacterales bacterium]|jgi:beta-N-acetylhexosaminidase